MPAQIKTLGDGDMYRSTTIALLLAATAALHPQAVNGAEEDGAAVPEFNAFYCTTPESLIDVAFVNERIRVNNIGWRKETHPLSGAPVVQLSASVVNHSDTRAAVSVELVGLSDSSIAFTVSALPTTVTLPGGASQQLASHVMEPPGGVGEVDGICVRVVALHDQQS